MDHGARVLHALVLFLSLTGQVSVAKASSSTEQNSDLRKTTKVISKCCAILRKDPHANFPSSFTICSTVMTPSISYEVLVFFNLWEAAYVAGNHGELAMNALMTVESTSEGLVISANWKQQWKNLEKNGTELYALPNQWIKGCVAYNFTSGLYQMVVDGIFVRNYTRPVGKIPTDLSGKISHGERQLYGGWVPVNHKLTNMNIYSTAHSVEVMRQNTRAGKYVEDGDYLAWREMEWNLTSEAEIETVGSEEPCQEKPLVDVYNTRSGPERIQNMESCMQLCEKLRSRTPSITTIEEWNILNKFFLSYSYPVPSLWIGINDNQVEGEWRDYYTHQVMNHTEAWAAWAPNGQRRENCAHFVKGSDGNPIVEDGGCDEKHFCMCKRQPHFYLKFRGLCNNSAIETYYWPRNDLTQIWKLKLIGLRSEIEHDAQSGLWRLSVVGHNVTAISKTSLSSFTLGRHNWTITGDKGCNEDINSDFYTTELKMSGCADGEFTCNDGQCISMDQRCDQLPNCRDASDEMGCNILILKEGYNMNIPPITSDQKGKKVAVEVGTSIDIFKLVDINEEDYSIEIQFLITMIWRENRATYQNLKAHDSLNALTQNDIEKLWLPRVIYENTDQKDTTRLGANWEWETHVEVRRLGNFTRSGLDIVDEANMFQGNENNLVMRQTYTRQFQCLFDFQWYPFDTQVEIFLSFMT